jgi:hypothetical protein
MRRYALFSLYSTGSLTSFQTGKNLCCKRVYVFRPISIFQIVSGFCLRYTISASLDPLPLRSAESSVRQNGTVQKRGTMALATEAIALKGNCNLIWIIRPERTPPGVIASCITNSFDNICSRCYRFVCEAAVRRRSCTFFLFLVTLVVLVSVIPPRDLPETAYNEVDTPLNQTAQVVSAATLVLARAPGTPVVLPKQVRRVGPFVSRKSLEQYRAHLVFSPAPLRLQDFLCTFLI